MMEPLHASDAGDVLEALEADERVQLVRMLGDRFDYLALTEVDDGSLRPDRGLPASDVARGVSTLDNDDAVYILEDIEEEDREESSSSCRRSSGSA
jgi:magnesium transporter